MNAITKIIVLQENGLLTVTVGAISISVDKKSLPDMLQNLRTYSISFGLEPNKIINLVIDKYLPLLKDVFKCEYMFYSMEYNGLTGDFSINECITRGWNINVFKYVELIQSFISDKE
jgi:hypothetical protein